MSTIAKHSVPNTTITIYIEQGLRGYLVMAIGDPRFQQSKRVRGTDVAKARAVANEMWMDARARFGSGTAQPVQTDQTQVDADERAMNDAVAKNERESERAVYVAKMQRDMLAEMYI